MVKTQDKRALRYDEGKPRHDLIPTYAINELAKVYTMGAKKYADNNWRKGMKWSRVFASLKRHLNYFEEGKDLDDESGLNHMAHVIWNAVTLLEYTKIYPQGDDRYHRYLYRPKIGLDIDEVLCDWVTAWSKKWGYPTPETWNFSYVNSHHFKELVESGELEDFYLNIPRKISPNELKFEPHCYITSRSVPVELTKKWLQNNGFPTMPVYSVGFEQSKVDVARESGIDIFIDDRYENFVELNRAGICTYLLDAKHNKRYEVGYKRIKNINDVL